MRIDIIYLSAAWALSAHAGGFLNLGFDAPDRSSLQTEVVHVYPRDSYEAQYSSVSRLLPGWQLAFDGVPVDKVYYGSGPAGVVLTQPGIDSSYSIYVQGGRVDPNTGQELTFQVSLSQRGIIPQGSSELRFYSHFFNPAVQVKLGGVAVPVEYLDLPSQPYIFAANVSPFAGQEMDLELVSPVWAGSKFDIMGFYPIPEPSTFALLGLGGLGLAWAARRRRV